MRLHNDRYEEIKDIVANLFEENEVLCVPVSGFELGHNMNIKIIPYSSYVDKIINLLMKKSQDGFFVESEDGYRIYYNDKKKYTRVNYTIMHEIGHIVLGHSEESDLAEAEANFFAKFALAPPVLIHKLGANSPQAVAEKFDLGIQFASYAYGYYLKWQRYRKFDYTSYELKILKLFEKAI